MWRKTSNKWLSLPSISSLLNLSTPLLSRPTMASFQTPLPIQTPIFVPPLIPIPSLSKPFSSSPFTTHKAAADTEEPDEPDEPDSDDDLETFTKPTKQLEGKLLQNVEKVMASLQDFDADSPQAKHRLETCGVPVYPQLVKEVLSRLRNHWAAAFTFFLWAAKQPGYSHSPREYHFMISVLGKMRRFDTAWSLVEEMRGRSLVTPQTLLLLIRKYCAIHDVGKAINVFYTFKRFGFKAEIADFHGLLGALCRYKNVEDAEHLLLCNATTFPFETKSFNIVLNGWCNVLVYIREAKRFWREMGNKGISKDVVSYGCMISCYSKAGNLNDVLKLFNQMKELGVEPDLKVYNAVVYALAKGSCVEEAKKLLKTMEEKGLVPNAVTFNSLIRPLCKARRLDDARVVFDEMLKRDLSPSIRTYHAFFDVLRTAEEVFDLLNQMKGTGCKPVSETYIMLIRKLCRWREFERVYRLWDEMQESGVSPDHSAYIVLIHGLFLNGKLDDAFKFYEDMKRKDFAPEPRTEEMIQAWLSGKETFGQSVVEGSEEDPVSLNPVGKKPKGVRNTSSGRRYSPKKPEIRSVTRERGFSLW